MAGGDGLPGCGAANSSGSAEDDNTQGGPSFKRTGCCSTVRIVRAVFFRRQVAYLLSLSDAIDTRSASGKLVPNVLTSVAQWEREAISDRTREAMDHLKRQGVRLGGAPYGWRYSTEVDKNGRRRLVKHPDEQRAIKRICALHSRKIPAGQIAKCLEQEGLPARGKKWHTRSICHIKRSACAGLYSLLPWGRGTSITALSLQGIWA